MFRVASRAFVVAFLFAKFVVAERPEDDRASTGRDSYLKAHAATKKLNEKSDDFYDPHSYPDDGFDYYGPPKPVYGPPKPVYGPPIPYPHHHYGSYPPAPAPPPSPPHYGPPEPFIPHALLGILDKIKYKIDLLTIGKIILKLVIFKKIVAWIGIICLLLFLPSLKKKHFFFNNNHNGIDGGGDMDLLRSFNRRNSDVDDRINNLGNFVLDSLKVSDRKYYNDSECGSIYCKSWRFRDYINDKLTYGRLLELYSKEL